jgi:hypothetical protein
MKYAALALLALATPLAAQDRAPFPEFLRGEWIQRDGENWTREVWANGDVRMLGTSSEGTGDVVQTRENLAIERAGDRLVLIAQPGDSPPVVFPVVRQDETSIEFANPQHDYPQRIRYWREGDLLKAEIALIDGTQAVGWTYQPVG